MAPFIAKMNEDKQTDKTSRQNEGMQESGQNHIKEDGKKEKKQKK